MIKNEINNHKIISSYNEINKLYSCFVLSIEEFDKLTSKERKKFNIVVMTKKVKGPTPPKIPQWAVETRDMILKAISDLKQEVDSVKQEVNSVKQEVDSVKNELHTIVKLNNLKTN